MVTRTTRTTSRLTRLAPVASLLVVLGCVASSNGQRPQDGTVPEYVAQHTAALGLFDQGEYKTCIEAFDAWLRKYDGINLEHCASARFFTALAHKKLGDIEEARAGFRGICERYAAVPHTSRSAKWRNWAREELTRLGK